VPDVYTHGHHESVLRSHIWRTAGNSAGYLLGELRPGIGLLDLGCGPGTITTDLARLVPGGGVIGLDASEAVVSKAASGSKASAGGARFAAADLYHLPFEDAAFDVVHAHQVLQHLTEPVGALREAARVLSPGGLLAVRDSDYGSFLWGPTDPRLDQWLELYHQVTHHNGAEADAGRHLPAWVRAAGFIDLRVTSSTWTFSDPESCDWWGSLWADRVISSAFAEQAQAYGLATRDQLQDLSDAWRAWAVHTDAVFVTPHVEVLARLP
jgi:ubiquinone/menaquinone biosynthesis C-methylase UbiE